MVFRINSSLFSVFSHSSYQESLSVQSTRTSNPSNHKFKSFCLLFLNCENALALLSPADPPTMWTNTNPGNLDSTLALPQWLMFSKLQCPSIFITKWHSMPALPFYSHFFHISLNPCYNLSEPLQLLPICSLRF